MCWGKSASSLDEADPRRGVDEDVGSRAWEMYVLMNYMAK